jgi:hypothetical protein
VDDPLSIAGRALSAGDPLHALRALAEGTSAPARALRGIALSQLGETHAARRLLLSAHASFHRSRQPLFAARCAAALAELDAVDGRFRHAHRRLGQSRRALRKLGDRANAAWLALIEARLRTLLGDAAGAASVLRAAERDTHPHGRPLPRLDASFALARAEMHLRALEAEAATRALASARWAARRAGHAVLLAEVDRLSTQLATPVATVNGTQATLAELERLFHRRDTFVVDGLRRRLLDPAGAVDLRRRPVLFALLATLAQAFPRAVPARALAAQAFETRQMNDSVTARLRVELSRLRRALGARASLEAGPSGWTLRPARGSVPVCVRSVHEGARGALWGLLADGSLWSAAVLARVLGLNVRTVQRGLADLGPALASHGRGPARRYALADASAGIATRMLLVAAEQDR